MSSSGDEVDALQNLRRELEAIRQRGETAPAENEPPVAELEALAQTLTQLKSQDAVPFDRKHTWEVIEEQLAPDASSPDQVEPDA